MVVVKRIAQLVFYVALSTCCMIIAWVHSLVVL